MGMHIAFRGPGCQARTFGVMAFHGSDTTYLALGRLICHRMIGYTWRELVEGIPGRTLNGNDRGWVEMTAVEMDRTWARWTGPGTNWMRRGNKH